MVSTKIKNKMKKSFYLLIFCFLSGCGVTTSEVVPAGKDTYMISGHGYAIGGPEAMLELYKAANRYCLGLERHFLPVSTNTVPFDQRSSSVSMNFRCLLAGDRELERPMMRIEPTTRIEVIR
jgi:hypothetical protein